MKTTLLTCATILACQGPLSAQNMYELTLDPNPSSSYASQYGNKLNCTTKVRQTYASLDPPSFTVGFYLSPDTIITTADLLVGSVNVPCMNPFTPSCVAVNNMSEITKVVSINVDLATKSVPTGTYYVGTYVDSQNTVTEDDETNNQATYKKSGGTFFKVNFPGLDVGISTEALPDFVSIGRTAQGAYEIVSLADEKLTVNVYSIDGRLLATENGLQIILPKLNSEMCIIKVSDGKQELRKKLIL